MVDNKPPEALPKMTSGGQELREHDFPVSRETARRHPGAVAVDTGAPGPESVRSGGKNGTVTGDVQPAGDVGTIMNQDAVDPANFDDN